MPTRALPLLLTLLVVACGGGGGTPDLDRLELRMNYDEVARIVGSQCSPLTDKGFRELRWTYSDGSAIVAGILDGRASGVEVEYPDGFDRRGKADAALAKGVQGDSPEAFMRKVLGDDPVTVEDSSDRDCRWELAGGALTAVFKREELREATWQTGIEIVSLVTVTDPVAMLLEDLRSGQKHIRVQALTGLKGLDDPRIADALLDLLRGEHDSYIRGKAALKLAGMDERRASSLLMPDLEGDIIYDDVIHAIGRIGDLRAADALQIAFERSRNTHTRGELHNARQTILSRTKMESR